MTVQEKMCQLRKEKLNNLRLAVAIWGWNSPQVREMRDLLGVTFETAEELKEGLASLTETPHWKERA